MATVFWYKVPKTIVENQREIGVTSPITEIGIRPLTGDDEAAATAGLRDPNELRNRLLDRAFCGINRHPEAEVSGRVKIAFGGEDPNLYPENVRKAMHIRLLALVNRAFAKHNDGSLEELEDFLGSVTVAQA